MVEPILWIVQGLGVRVVEPILWIVQGLGVRDKGGRPDIMDSARARG